MYFNTYLADPRRPGLPDHPTTRMLLSTKEASNLAMPSAGFPGPPPAVVGYRPPPMVYPGQSFVCLSIFYAVMHNLLHCRPHNVVLKSLQAKPVQNTVYINDRKTKLINEFRSDTEIMCHFKLVLQLKQVQKSKVSKTGNA